MNSTMYSQNLGRTNQKGKGVDGDLRGKVSGLCIEMLESAFNVQRAKERRCNIDAEALRL